MYFDGIDYGSDQISSYSPPAENPIIYHGLEGFEESRAGGLYGAMQNFQRKSLRRDADMKQNYDRKKWNAGISLGMGSGRDNIKNAYESHCAPEGDELIGIDAKKLPLNSLEGNGRSFNLYETFTDGLNGISGISGLSKIHVDFTHLLLFILIIFIAIIWQQYSAISQLREQILSLAIMIGQQRK